jgi:hypothetical protein
MNFILGLLIAAGGAAFIIFHRKLMFYFGRIVWLENYIGQGRSDVGYIAIGLVIFGIGIFTMTGALNLAIFLTRPPRPE